MERHPLWGPSSSKQDPWEPTQKRRSFVLGRASGKGRQQELREGCVEGAGVCPQHPSVYLLPLQPSESWKGLSRIQCQTQSLPVWPSPPTVVSAASRERDGSKEHQG